MIKNNGAINVGPATWVAIHTDTAFVGRKALVNEFAKADLVNTSWYTITANSDPGNSLVRTVFQGRVIITGQAATSPFSAPTPTAHLTVKGDCIIESTIWHNLTKTVGTFTGTGTPESVVTASVGSVFHRTDGGAGTSFYVKESGSGNTGWVAK